MARSASSVLPWTTAPDMRVTAIAIWVFTRTAPLVLSWNKTGPYP